jgi:glycosyltransferase involved in cell wall biosynthesis
MISTHRIVGTWTGAVDRYIALTQFARRKFIEGGLPAAKISVKPNFVDPDPGAGDGGGKYALFVGRLSPEKGIETLLKAWSILPDDIPLRIAGVGPMAPQVQAMAARHPRITWLGELPRQGILDAMKAATFLICPSTWYESFGLIIVEAFSTGLPVLASDIGALSELIEHERTGLLFKTGDAQDLVTKVQWASRHPDRLAAMRASARREFETRYMADTNYRTLMAIYEDAWSVAPYQARPQAREALDVQ